VRGGYSDPVVKEELSYAWGLGISTNNQAEAYPFLQPPRLTSDNHITFSIVVEDSKELIQAMHKTFQPSNYKIASILTRISQEVSRFQKVKIRNQVLREHNSEANILAKESTRLKVGVLRINGTLVHQIMP
jgi:hypothetical protein